MAKKAIILLAEGFEEIEAISCIDILRRAEINLTVVGIDDLIIKGSRSIEVKADKKLNEISIESDACILPGGMPGAENLAKSGLVKKLLIQLNNQEKIIAAICASPAVVLAPLGILDNKIATCYPGMEKDFSNSTTYKKQEVIIDKNIITSRGPATAMQFALKIVEKLAGKEMSNKVAKATLFK
ncbi:MAG: DJ-1/PfpI family protein [Candidatus Omnitrophica bacterium]|nr:DJ-1/PfpI family protein [Candidatus Omnitrophota bacterium]MCF7888072.1 DJ-1/PfpI family protein [Candidatus Omnitrophota bacterium]